MELKLFTKSHDIKLLRENTQNHKPFTSEERSNISLMEDYLLNFRDLYKKIVLKEKEDLLAIIQFINKHNIKKIVSIGTDIPIKEYYISKKTDAEILCYDFNKTIIKKSKIIFKDKISINFYDMNTHISNIIEPDDKVDCIMFFQSLYIFNSKQYKIYLEELSNLKIKYIIDQASVISLPLFLRTMISRLIKFPIKLLLIKFFLNSDKLYIGKFHGYSKTKSTLIKIYDVLNLKIIRRFNNIFFLENNK